MGSKAFGCKCIVISLWVVQIPLGSSWDLELFKLYFWTLERSIKLNPGCCPNWISHNLQNSSLPGPSGHPTQERLRQELSAERDRQLEVLMERLSREHVERQVAAEAANHAKLQEARAAAGGVGSCRRQADVKCGGIQSQCKCCKTDFRISDAVGIWVSILV